MIPAQELIREVNAAMPAIRNAAWSEVQGMGYFRCDMNGSRRCVPVETSWPAYVMGGEKSLVQVAAEVVVGLES